MDDAAGASKAVLQIHKNNELREKLIVHGLQDVYDKFNVRRVAAEHGELFEKRLKEEYKRKKSTVLGYLRKR